MTRLSLHLPKRASLAWLLASLALTLLCRPGLAAEPRTWITGATVISAERHDSGRKLNVLIEGERIAAVSEALPAGAARDAQIIDAQGLYLIPGLIDSHVHVQTVPGMSPQMQYLHPFVVRDYRKQLPRSFLLYGYTTVVDLVPIDYGVLKDFASAPAHPDLYHCGAVPLINGYPTQYAPRLLRPLVFPDFVVDPQNPNGAPFGTSAAAHTPVAAIGRVKQEGSICVKTFFERGFGRDHDLPVPSAELYADIVKSAHAAGLPVLIHASSLEAQRFALAADTDILAHGMWNWNEFNGSATLPDPVRQILDQIVVRHVGYQATMQVIGGLHLLFEPDYLDRPEVLRVIPQSLLDWLRSPGGRWFKQDLAGHATDEQMRARIEATLWRGAEATAYLAQKNAFFLFGTDTPSGPVAGNLPGLNGYLEMQRLVAAKMSLRQLLEAATVNNAQALGLASSLGTITAGKRANLVLLGRSPLESVQAYGTVRAVWVGGKRFSPEQLEANR